VLSSTFTDHQGFRFQVFITDQDDPDLAQREARQRGHARVDDRIRWRRTGGRERYVARRGSTPRCTKPRRGRIDEPST
jgi:hypothetical protein